MYNKTVIDWLLGHYPRMVQLPSACSFGQHIHPQVKQICCCPRTQSITVYYCTFCHCLTLVLVQNTCLLDTVCFMNILHLVILHDIENRVSIISACDITIRRHIFTCIQNIKYIQLHVYFSKSNYLRNIINFMQIL